MQNITVIARKKEKEIEKHTCVFPKDIFLEFGDRTYDTSFMYELVSDRDGYCGSNNTKLQFTKLEVAVSYTFTIIVCNYAGCVNTTVQHDTSNWNCGPEDQHKVSAIK